MATLLSAATGNWTDAATWGVCNATAELDSEANTTAISTSNLDSATFAPGAITVDGVALKFSARASSPTGTFTVTLRNSTAGSDVTSVTVNVSDIPAGPSQMWIFFKFASPQLLLAATNYLVRVVCSNTGSQVTLFRNATSNNWSRQLRTTTTGAPAAGDKIIVCGEHTGAGTGNDITVTMDNTSTDVYGNVSFARSVVVSSRGILTFGTSSSTAYKLRWSGSFTVCGGATMNVGTSGTPIPSSSSALLEMVVATNMDSNFIPRGGSTLNMYGAEKNGWSLLTADASSSGTTLTVQDTTGWAVGDELGIASTTRTFSQAEKKLIDSVDSATQVTLTAGLTNAHAGTSPIQAEVVNLTRNVRIVGTSASLQGFVFVTGNAAIVMRYVEIKWMGGNTDNQRGVWFETFTGTSDMQFCATHEFRVATARGVIFNGSGTGTITYSNNVMYSINGTGIDVASAMSSSTMTIEDNVVMLCDNSSAASITLNWMGPAFNGNRINSSQQHVNMSGSWTGDLTFDGLDIHSIAQNAGISFLSGFNTPVVTFSNLKIWRCNVPGINMQNGNNQFTFIFRDCLFFGNTTQNIRVNGALTNVYLYNVQSNGDTTFSTTTGMSVVPPTSAYQAIYMEKCDFSTVSGIFTAHTTDIGITSTFSVVQITANYCKLPNITSFSGLSQWVGSFVKLQGYGQTAVNHQSRFPTGTNSTDSSIFRTAAPSERMTPLLASSKLKSSYMRSAVESGTSKTFSVYVRKSEAGDGAAYNGNQPRLVLVANPSIGIDEDQILDTASGAAGAWEELNGTTPVTSIDNGVFTVYVDCDGTAGWVNVDDWSVS